MHKPIQFIFLVLFSLLLKPSIASDYNLSVHSDIILKTDSTSAGQSLDTLFEHANQITGLHVIFPPGAETGWHQHPVPGMAYVIRGTITVEMESGKKFEYKAGQAYAEVVGKFHNGKNYGKDTLEIVAYFVGNKKTAITIKK